MVPTLPATAAPLSCLVWGQGKKNIKVLFYAFNFWMWSDQVKEGFCLVTSNMETLVVSCYKRSKEIPELRQAHRTPGWTLPRWEHQLKLVADESDKTLWSCPSTAPDCTVEIIHWHPSQCINAQDLFLLWFPSPFVCLCLSDPLRLEARLCSHLTFPFQC